MATHFPADHTIFALVTNENPEGSIKDPGLMRYAGDKVGDFISTPETDKTLIVIRDMEQRLGREIIWVKADQSFDDLIRSKNYIPNKVAAFCSQELKTIPVFWWCYFNLFASEGDRVNMQIGYRADEHWRNANPEIKLPISQSLKGQQRHKLKTFNWRELDYPLIENLVFKADILKWAKSSEYDFPPDDNCQHCFWKNPALLYKNGQRDRAKIAWAARMEKEIGGQWRSDTSYQSILKRRPQLDMFTEEQISPMCDTGFCTA